MSSNYDGEVKKNLGKAIFFYYMNSFNAFSQTERSS